MIGAPNTRGRKYWVGIVQWAPATLVSEEIADIFRNYNIDMYRQKQSLAYNVLNMTEKQLGRSFLLGAWIHYSCNWH